jgi:hypothetical protein
MQSRLFLLVPYTLPPYDDLLVQVKGQEHSHDGQNESNDVHLSLGFRQKVGIDLAAQAYGGSLCRRQLFFREGFYGNGLRDGFPNALDPPFNHLGLFLVARSTGIAFSQCTHASGTHLLQGIVNASRILKECGVLGVAQAAERVGKACQNFGGRTVLVPGVAQFAKAIASQWGLPNPITGCENDRKAGPGTPIEFQKVVQLHANRPHGDAVWGTRQHLDGFRTEAFHRLLAKVLGGLFRVARLGAKEDIYLLGTGWHCQVRSFVGCVGRVRLYGVERRNEAGCGGYTCQRVLIAVGLLVRQWCIYGDEGDGQQSKPKPTRENGLDGDERPHKSPRR